MRLSFGSIVFIWAASLGLALVLKSYQERPMDVHLSRAIASLGRNMDGANDDLCEHGENYSCEWRVFGLGEMESSAVQRRCVPLVSQSKNESTDGGTKELCLSVLKVGFRVEDETEARLPSSIPGSPVVGTTSGKTLSTNESSNESSSTLSVVHCTLQGRGRNKIIETEMGDLSSAVESLHTLCIERWARHNE